MLHFIATPRQDCAAGTHCLGELPFVAVPPLTVSFHSHAAAILALTNHAFCVDRLFVSTLESSAQDAAIVKAVASKGKSLHMRVVADGVESAYQARLLKGLECDELQGFLSARPMPAGQVEAFLRSAEHLAALPLQMGGELRALTAR